MNGLCSRRQYYNCQIHSNVLSKSKIEIFNPFRIRIWSPLVYRFIYMEEIVDRLYYADSFDSLGTTSYKYRHKNKLKKKKIQYQ